MRVNAKQGSGSANSLVGKTIHDRFRIIAPIARGGMGAVYKAEQAPLGRLVAIKVLSPKHDEEKDPEFRKRFFLEAATVAKLTHPNTVTVFDYGQSEGLYFIVMELLEGVTLKSALRESGPFEPARAIHITKQICRSLREAHRLGVIHRDMKPGNVMLLEQGDESDFVKVLDFGLVKDIEAEDEDDLTQTGVFMGSPKYMSPEQIQGERVDARSDIYSVGVMLYEMLSGAPPFVREKQVQVLMDHIHSPVPPMPPEVPVELARIVERCLAKKRKERFADMDELLVALKTAAGELSLPQSTELGISGEFSSGTPVSGVHAVAGTLEPRTTNESISVPTVLNERPSVTPSGLSVPTVTGATEPTKPSRVLPAVLGAAVLVLGATLAVLLFVPRDAAPTAETTPEPPALALAAEPETSAASSKQAADEAAFADEPPAPPLRSLMVELDSRPRGAMVRIGDAEYGPTPATVELTGELAEPGAELTFVFALAGHRETTVVRTVPAEGRLDVSARLRRIVQRTPLRSSRDEARPVESVTPAGYRDSPY